MDNNDSTTVITLSGSKDCAFDNDGIDRFVAALEQLMTVDEFLACIKINKTESL